MAIKYLSVLLCIALLASPARGASSPDQQDTIKSISNQIVSIDNPSEKAKLYCFRARNYAKAGENGKARDDYLRAINSSYEGWILNELAQFMFKNGEFEKAYNVADRVLADFPQFEKEAIELKKQSRAKWEAQYLKENPPTIIMNTAPDPNRVTRHDLIKQTESRQVTQPKAEAYRPSTPGTYKGSATNSKRNSSGGSHVSGFGVGSEFRQNYKKSRQQQ